MSTNSAAFSLVDGEEMNAEHPDTFHVPSGAEKAAVKIGDIVKLGFLDTDGAGERMWVIVTEAQDGIYKGTLDNDPIVIPICCGDVIAFESKHIISILTAWVAGEQQ